MYRATTDLIVVRRGSFLATEQRALSRGVEDGLFVRVRRGVYLAKDVWGVMSPEQRHLVRMEALAAVSVEEPVFSHWSAAVALGLPILDRRRLERVHTTLPLSGRRSVHGAAVHLAPILDTDLIRTGPLLVTGAGRTVVDVAGASPFVEGVVTADGALRSGIRRTALQQALETSDTSRGRRRAGEVIGFAHPGAESAAESRSRCTMLRIGFAPMLLQHDVYDRRGHAGRLDFFDPVRRIGGEVDGAKKYLDPAIATAGAGKAVYEEKLREDRVRAVIARLVRWGWIESGDPLLLSRMFAAAGLLPSEPRATLQDYIAAANAFG